MYWSSHSFWFSFTDFEVRTTVCRIFNVTMEMLLAFLWMVTLDCHVRVSSHCSMVTLQVRLSHSVVTLFHKINSLFIHINIVREPKRQDPKALWEVSLKNFQPLHNSTIKNNKTTTKVNSCDVLYHTSVALTTVKLWTNFEGLTATHMTLQSCCVGVRP